jgi:hypothetical protein
MTPEEVMAEEEPQFVVDMQADLDELEARSVEVDCSTETMQELLAERAGDLTAESDIGQMMITVMQSEGIFEN